MCVITSDISPGYVENTDDIMVKLPGILTRSLLALGVILTLVTCASAFPPGEQLSNTSISVVMDNNYPPYSFQDENGTLQGILIDEWKLWEQKTGISVHIQGMEWGQALRRMEAGEFDVIDTIFYNEDRAKIYDFTGPYASLDVPIFFNRNISGISGPETARGFVVGVKTGDNAISVLKQFGLNNFQEFSSYQEIITAARDGKIMVFCVDKPPALYYLYKFGISDQYFQTAPIYTGEFHRAVRKGNTRLLQTVEEGFTKISAIEKKSIEERWYRTPVITPEYFIYIIAIGLIIGLLIIILIIWNHLLQNSVAQKTRDLQKEIDRSNKQAKELAESEKFLSNIVENIPDMIFVKDAKELRFVRFNKAGEDLIGYSRNDLYGRTVEDLFSETEADYFTRMDARTLQSGKLEDIPEENIQTRYRGQRILHTKKIPILDEDGNPQYLLGISEDITERKRFEVSLNSAQKKLNLLNSIIFTDIQNKLYSLYAYIELQKDSVIDGSNNYAENEIQLIKDIQYLLKSTKDYQDLGVKSPNWHNVQQSFLIGISHVSITHLTRNIDLDNLEIFSDPLLEKVFFILADNLVKHSSSATELRCYYRYSQDDLIIIFEDNGIGISDSDKETIFTRANGSTIQMGLFLAKEILGVTNIGIQETGIWGKGARFEIHVPQGGFRFTERR